jgi:hypothetical protein
VCAALGARPEREDPQRERWDQLARALERHRLEYGINVRRDGPLGPAPTRDLGAAYAAQRDRLAAHVREFRAARGLQPAPPELGLDLQETATSASSPDRGRTPTYGQKLLPLLRPASW